MIEVHPIGKLLDRMTTGANGDLVARHTSGSLERIVEDELMWGSSKASHVMAALRYAERVPSVWYLDPTLSGLVRGGV